MLTESLYIYASHSRHLHLGHSFMTIITSSSIPSSIALFIGGKPHMKASLFKLQYAYCKNIPTLINRLTM